MNDFISTIIAALGVVAIVFIVAVFGGTFVWLVWPVVNHAFPKLVADGVLASSLSWWDSVCLTWLLGLLIKSSHTTKAADK
jgi:hypothetical protein